MFVELRPPDLVELVEFLREETRDIPAGTDLDEGLLTQLARPLQGLTLDEARYALRRALARSSRLGPESMPALLEEKRLLVNRSGVLEYISEGTDIGDVGGLEDLKNWLLERQKLFADARRFEQRNRAQGRSPDGDSGLRQESRG